MLGILDELALKYSVYISDLRLCPFLTGKAFSDLSDYLQRQTHPLNEWSDTVSYLSGRQIAFQTYQEVEDYLKQFSTSFS